MTPLFLEISESTIGNPLNLPEILLMDINDAKGNTYTTVSLMFNQGSFKFNVSNTKQADLMPGCNNAVHLTAAVTNALIKHSMPYHRTIDQAFDSDDIGKTRKLPLEF